MPFVAPKGTSSAATSNSGPGGGGRTTFRPPWVKDDGTATPAKTTVKTSVPWSKKTAAEKENGEKPATTTTQSALKKPATAATSSGAKTAEPAPAAKKIVEPVKKTVEPTKKVVEPAKKVVEPAKKVVEPAKKVVEPAKKIIAPVKKTPPEPIKKTTAAPAAATKTTANAVARNAAVKKKEPTPSSSEEEEEESEEEETEEEETEEESEEEETDDEEEDEQPIVVKQLLRKPQQPQPKKEEEESELKRRFSIEKPKLRPVVVKRDKSMKKIEDDDEAVEGETEEERERRLRFKLEKPKLRHIKRDEKPLSSKSTENVLKIRPALKKVPKVEELIKEPKEEPKPEFKTKTLRKTPSISKSNVPAPPPLPSLVPKAPPPPPPPLGAPGQKRELTSAQKTVIDKLKTRPRRRPDWSEMMKEVESGRKLRHVQCNDRSQPILTCKSMTKVDDKFIYETEKDNSHNKLLKQIQGGLRLKPTKTNDRSRPVLNGLRKFRRQMTIEEQLQKSQSKVNMLGEAPGGTKLGGGDDVSERSRTSSIVAALSIDDPSGDELDDIDKIRDDLQSTKQMLALELRNREAQERENKKLHAIIATLEAELAREKSREKNLEYGSNVIVATMDATPFSEEAYINSLKQEADDARKTSKELEKKYHVTGEVLDEAKSEIEEQKRQIQMLERKLAQALQGDMTSTVKRSQFNFCYSYEDPNDSDTYYPMDSEYETTHYNKTNKKGGGSLNGSRRPSDVHTGRDSSPEFDLPLSESDPDEPEEKKNERRERRLTKEVKVLKSKLTKLKVKEEASKKEKDALKQAMKKNHVILKAENKKFKKLEKEVHKMAASMKEDEENDEADEEKEIENENEEAEERASEEESEEESEESESEESGPDTESESEAEDATNADKKNNLEPRVKKHESRHSAMKKCNVLLQANVDNLQDEITQVRVKAASLQSELDAVLQDLGF